MKNIEYGRILEYDKQKLENLYKMVSDNNDNLPEWAKECNCSPGFKNEAWLVGVQYTSQDAKNGNLPDPLYMNTETCPNCGFIFIT